MLSDLQQAALKIITEHPGIKASEIGRRLGRDRRQSGRLADLLVERDYAERQSDDGGWTYWPRGTLEASGNSFGASGSSSKAPKSISSYPGDNEQIVDADFREVQSKPATAGRALAVPGQPFDSRIASALRQHSQALAKSRQHSGMLVNGQVVAALNDLFVADPNGEFLAAAQHHENMRQIEANHAMRLEEDRQHTEARQRAEAEERAALLRKTIMAAGSLLTAPATAPERQPSKAEQKRQEREARRREDAEQYEERWETSVRRVQQQRTELYGEEQRGEPAEPRKPAPRDAVAELLGRAKKPVVIETKPPSTAGWQQWALAAGVVGALVCVLKFSGGLAA